MAIYYVENSWGGSGGHQGGTWVLGCRDGQAVVAVELSSKDGGKTLEGTMTYAGEGPIGVIATQTSGNNYSVKNSWGGSGGHPGGNWIIGGRDGQNVIALSVKDAGKGNLEGQMTYEGEGHIGFKSTVQAGPSYYILNSWGSSSGNPGGTFVLGNRANQNPINFEIESKDDGKTFTGYMTYENEGHIGVQAKLLTGNTYAVENQWGGSSAPWHPGGNFVIGSRVKQRCVSLQINSKDGGKSFDGYMTYSGEGHIGTIATISTCN